MEVCLALRTLLCSLLEWAKWSWTVYPLATRTHSDIGNFEAVMGITGNAIDESFKAGEDIPRILTLFASSCVTAAQLDSQNCPLASASLKANDPATDLINRINNMVNSLLQSSYLGDDWIFSVRFFDRIAGCLSTPGCWQTLANELDNLESSIKDNLTVTLLPNFISQSRETKNTNLTLASYEEYGEPFEAINDVQWAGVTCADSNFSKIQTAPEFTTYLSQQMLKNPIMGYRGMSRNARCLNWPNLSKHNLEQYRSPFPKTIQNKMLMIAETNNPKSSYEGVLSTYEYVGANNSHILIHDALGQTIDTYPNNCTYSAIRAFYLKGDIHFT